MKYNDNPIYIISYLIERKAVVISYSFDDELGDTHKLELKISEDVLSDYLETKSFDYYDEGIRLIGQHDEIEEIIDEDEKGIKDMFLLDVKSGIPSEDEIRYMLSEFVFDYYGRGGIFLAETSTEFFALNQEVAEAMTKREVFLQELKDKSTTSLIEQIK